MKKVSIWAVSLALIVSLVAAKMNSILDELKISEKQVQSMVLTSVVEGYLDFPRQAVKRIDASRRPEIVSFVGVLAKKYTQTEHFKQQYKAYRDAKKPVQEENALINTDLNVTMIANYKKAIADTEKVIKETKSAEMKKALEGSIVSMKEQLKAMEEMPKEEREIIKQISEESNKMKANSFAQELADFEEEYPANPDAMLKLRLKEFIKISKSVDFQAETTAKNGKNRFVNAQYEGKSSEWKLCYRAGKPAVEAAVAFAELWLSELEK